MEHFKFFSNKECEYYPCHKTEGDLNCLFCYCPLYFIPCPGNYSLLPNGDKDCSLCVLPHLPDGWDIIQDVLQKHYKGKS